MARETVAEFRARGGRVKRVPTAGKRDRWTGKKWGTGKLPGFERARRATEGLAVRIDRAAPAPA